MTLKLVTVSFKYLNISDRTLNSSAQFALHTLLDRERKREHLTLKA